MKKLALGPPRPAASIGHRRSCCRSRSTSTTRRPRRSHSMAARGCFEQARLAIPRRQRLARPSRSATRHGRIADPRSPLLIKHGVRDFHGAPALQQRLLSSDDRPRGLHRRHGRVRRPGAVRRALPRRCRRAASCRSRLRCRGAEPVSPRYFVVEAHVHLTATARPAKKEVPTEVRLECPQAAN